MGVTGADMNFVSSITHGYCSGYTLSRHVYEEIAVKEGNFLACDLFSDLRGTLTE